MSTIDDIVNADRNLTQVLKPLKDGGGGWLDVQKALWDCYVSRSEYQKYSKIKKFFDGKDRFVKEESLFLPWYKKLWGSCIDIIKRNQFNKLISVKPTLHQYLGTKTQSKIIENVKKKQKECKWALSCLISKNKDAYDQVFDDEPTNDGILFLENCLNMVLRKKSKITENLEIDLKKVGIEHKEQIDMIVDIVNKLCEKKAKQNGSQVKFKLEELKDKLTTNIVSFVKSEIDKIIEPIEKYDIFKTMQLCELKEKLKVGMTISDIITELEKLIKDLN